jgi:alpha-galactosidase
MNVPAARLVSLRAGGAHLLLDIGGAQLPRVLHWGADLGDLDLGSRAEDLLRALRPASPNGAFDEAPPLTVLPTEADGWSGAPGLAGHRAGAAVHPVLRLRAPTEVTEDPAGGGLVLATAGDDVCGIEVEVRLRLDPHGVVMVDAAVTSTASGEYDLGALRLALPLPRGATEVLDTTGRWCREASPQRQRLRSGTWWRPSRRGRTGHDGPLFVAAGSAGFGFRHGQVWATHLAWSGDSEHLVERLPEGSGGHAAVLGAGELLRPGEVRLGSGQTYRSPTAYYSWSADGLDGVAQRWHRQQRARPEHPKMPRPVVLNTWEAVYLKHDLDRLRDLADVAARVGVERFVLDDGWFRRRRNVTSGLGDWYVDEIVWPKGLHPLVEHVRALGMELGIWIEPEMINLDSDLAREHPEWILRADGGQLPPDWRFQQVLDLTQPDAWKYLLERLDALVTEYGPAFLKWDHNRDLHAAGPGARVHGQTLALYSLLDTLRERHPQLEIESCASGGGRVDLGILARSDRVWTSDCNDPLERQHIQRWTGQLVAPELLGAHIGPAVAHTTLRSGSLTMRCVTALFGHAGLEWDLRTATPDELDQVTRWVGLYRELRPLLHSGDVVRADLPDDCAVLHGVVSGDRSEAVLAYVQLATSPDLQPGRVQLPGLDPGRVYDVRMRPEIGPTRTLQLRPPGWLEPAEGAEPWTPDGTPGGPALGEDVPGLRLPGSFLTDVGIAMPVLTPASAILLHLRAI